MAASSGGARRLLLLLAPPSRSDRVRGGLTDREVRLLFEMRRLQEALKEAPPPLRRGLLERWASLRREREEARRERMVLLGHEA